MAEKFHFKQGDVLRVDSTKIGSGQYGDWQYIKVRSPDGKTNSQLFLSQINEQIHDGDFVRVDEIDVYPRRAKVENTKGELAWTTIFKVDIKISLAEDHGGFDTQFEDVESEEMLPF